MALPDWILDYDRRHPNDFWMSKFKSNSSVRIQAHLKFKTTDYSAGMCHVCKWVDFGYLFFGALDSGFRDKAKTCVFLGLLSDVKRRADSGCSFCRHILLPEVREILAIDKEVMREKRLSTFDSTEMNVFLTSGDISASRDDLQDMTHGEIFVELEPTTTSSVTVMDLGTILEEGTKTAIPSRPVRLLNHPLSRSVSLNSSPNLSRCRKWLDECQNSHTKCRENQFDRSSGGGSGMVNKDFKLIELSSGHVVELGDATGVSYATLSYVCGRSDTLWKLPKASQLWTVGANGRRRHPLPSNVPKTVSDAMTVVQDLGLQYLWVDSFCITQDDPVELQNQIQAMYQIYTRASICIVAGSGSDSHSGLPGIRQTREVNSSCQVKVKEGLMVGLPQPMLGDVLPQYRWMKRAWTYQELILSRRCLIFTDREAFFYCAEMTCRESCSNPSREGWFRLESNSYLIGNRSVIQEAGLTKNGEKLCRTYVAAVDEYSLRELSYQTDGLNAFQGLSELLSLVMDTEMIFGCPQKMLVNCLMWVRTEVTMKDHPQRRMMARPEDKDDDKHLRPLFPSWAWVAWKGHLRIPLFHYYVWGSEMQVLDPSLVPQIPASPHMVYNFMTTAGERDEPSSILQGIIPVLTKVAMLPVALDDDFDEEYPPFLKFKIPGGTSVNGIDIRGQQDRWNPQEKYGLFIQVWVETGRSQSVHLMMIETTTLLKSNNTPSEEDLQKCLRECDALKTARPLTAQRMRTDAKFMSKMSEECPSTVHIDASDSDRERDVLLASRIGTAYLDLGAWIRANPRDVIVLLG